MQKEFFQNDKNISEERNYNEIEFPVQEKDFNKIQIKSNYMH